MLVVFYAIISSIELFLLKEEFFNNREIIIIKCMNYLLHFSELDFQKVIQDTI